MKYSLRILKNKNIFKKHNYPLPNAFVEHQIFLDHQLKPFFFCGGGGGGGGDGLCITNLSSP